MTGNIKQEGTGTLRTIKTASVLLALVGGMCCSAFAADTPTTLEVHGYLQNRFYSAPGSTMEFRSERVSISTIAKFANDSTAYAELYYHPWTASNGLLLESGYYDTGLGSGRVRIGKGRRMTFGITPAYPNRKTSNYGLVGEAVTQDRIQGVQYMLNKGLMNYGFSAHTGYRLGIRNIGDIPGDDVRNPLHLVPHLCLRDPVAGGGNATTSPGQLSKNIQFSGRVGAKLKNGLSLGFSGSAADLDPRDLTNLRGDNANPATNPLLPNNPFTGKATTTPLGKTFTDNKTNQFGPDFTYKMNNNLTFQGEFYKCKVSDLDYNVWNVMSSYEFSPKWRFIARYSKQDMDIAKTDNALTWDTNQISLSAVQNLTKTSWLQYEYEINGTSTNTGATPKDNVFFVELFTGF